MLLKKHLQDYVPRVVNNLMIYSSFISSKTIFALFLGIVSLAFDLSDPRKMHIFGEVSVQIFCPFKNWVVCSLIVELESSLYILDTNTFSDM